MDPYASCPCGSGKKFKWCCQPIHLEIDKAFKQEAEGQMEAALRTMEEVTRQHPDNPEAWGRRAQMLYLAERTDEAEETLQKAFNTNPNYAFGYLLKGNFRLAEGEIPGALMLFRKAADLYDPQAHDILAGLFFNIFDCEMKLNHPVAARAALQLALRYNPTSQELRDGFEQIFGPDNNNLPPCAKREYRYLPVSSSAAEARRAAWENALSTGSTGKLGDAARAFEMLVRDDENDAAAWFNLGLTQAWQGNNLAALESLERYTALETDETRAAQAWTLAEILRCGQGLEDQADHVEYSTIIPLQDPGAFVEGLSTFDKDGLLTGARIDRDQGVLTAMILEKPAPALTPELEARQAPQLGAFLMMAGNLVRLWNVSRAAVDRAVQALQERVGRVMGPPQAIRGPVKFFDILAEHLVFPRIQSSEEYQSRLRENMEKFFEEVWLHRPLKSLSGTPPIDAAGHPMLKKKLRGVVQFLEECGSLAHFPYDFNRLRHKLGLAEAPAAAPAAAGPAGEIRPTLDIGALGAAELAGLATDTLNDAQLDEAFQAALKLDARDIAGRFADALVQRPPRADKPDRYPFFNHLVQLAQTQGDWTTALDRINEGEKDDCSNNEGRRRNDYELRRAQIHARAGQLDQAQDVFDRLIARVPTELKFRGSAAEAMLSAKAPAKALAYAEGGLAEARKQNHRDSEQYFLELASAARKQGA